MTPRRDAGREARPRLGKRSGSPEQSCSSPVAASTRHTQELRLSPSLSTVGVIVEASGKQHGRLYNLFFGGPVRFTITTGLLVAFAVAAVLGVISIFSTSEGTTVTVISPTTPLRPVEPDHPPKSRAEEVKTRDFWASPPQMYKDIPGTFADNTVSLDFSGSDVRAITPAELVETLPSYSILYEGEIFFIVGRVLESAIRPSAFGLGREIVLAGKTDAPVAVVGTPYDASDSSSYERGQVIYALVGVAALGDARVSRPGSELRRTVYLVTSNGDVNSLDGPAITPVRFPIARGAIGSEAIRSRAVAVRQP